MKALLLGTLTLRTATGTTGALLIVWNKYLNSTGSVTITLPSSNNCISATEAMGLVIDAMLKMVSRVIGALASLSRQP